MRGSSLTTFLMFLPLIAIPLLAIFGVPEFTPVNASTPTDANGAAIAIDGPVRKSNADRSLGRSLERNDDVFSPVSSGTSGAPRFPAGSLKPEGDPFLNEGRNVGDGRKPGKHGLNGWEIDEDRRGSKRSTNRVETPILDERPNAPAGPTTDGSVDPHASSRPTGGAALQSVPSMPENTATAFTWRKAVRTLNRMGIKDFLLQPGSRADEFHFSCLYTSPVNPRVAHRFEAEDADPLQAVQKVLQQIRARQ